MRGGTLINATRTVTVIVISFTIHQRCQGNMKKFEGAALAGSPLLAHRSEALCAQPPSRARALCCASAGTAIGAAGCQLMPAFYLMAGLCDGVVINDRSV